MLQLYVSLPQLLESPLLWGTILFTCLDISLECLASVLVMPDSFVSLFQCEIFPTLYVLFSVPEYKGFTSPHVSWVVLGNFGHQASVSFNLLHFIDSTAVDFINDFFIFFLRKEPCCLDTFCKWLLFFTCRFGGIAVDFSCSYCRCRRAAGEWSRYWHEEWTFPLGFIQLFCDLMRFFVTFITACCRAGVLMSATGSLPMREPPPPPVYGFPC